MNRKAFRLLTMVILGLLSALSFGLVHAQTPGTIPIWLANLSLGDSVMRQNGQQIVVQTDTASYGFLHTDGDVVVGSWVGTGASGSGGWFGTRSNHPLQFFTADGPTRMTIATNGNVGIGTASPTAKLDVNGSGFFSSFLVARTTLPDADGVSGISSAGDAPYGVYGSNLNSTSPNRYAGFFMGRVRATGGFFSGFGASEIDHPLDPDNKYLAHPFVASSEMKNIYDGIVVLDARGEAWVDLPEYFETLNRDYRYQLTGIGGFAPVYIAQKIAGNRFQIAGGQPGMEVSWQVTGIRQDAFANAHRVEVERDKAVKERNYYLHPALYGQSDEKSIEWAHKPELMRQMKEARGK